MTILPDLEAQLLELADRAASPTRRRRRRLPAGALPTTLAVAAAVAVAAIAIITLGNRSHTSTSPESPPVPPAASRLVAELAVLRRPQTPADLNSTYLDLFLRNGVATPPRGRLGQPIRSLIRLATITPWGEKVFLVPLIESDGRATLALIAGGSSCCSTAADVAEGQAGMLSGSGGPGGVSRNSVVNVFPDGVAKVTILLPRQGIPGEPAYKHELAITVPVRDNVAAFQTTRSADSINFQDMIWYGPDGNVVRRIGNSRNLNRVVPPPRPSPPTALSRRAQADPSTPNPVSVTPRIGGLHTTFTISFRLLLSGASYQYRFSGPGGTGCHGKTPSRAGGGIGGGPYDIRGQEFSEPFSPSSGAGPAVTAWCPGTFHVSVSAFGVPGRRALFYPPFGTVTFTVKPRPGARRS